MDKLKAMHTFVRIVEANSFSKAAETLALPRAALTATMKNLEAYLGVQLLQRTTRRLSLTRMAPSISGTASTSWAPSTRPKPVPRARRAQPAGQAARGPAVGAGAQCDRCRASGRVPCGLSGHRTQLGMTRPPGGPDPGRHRLRRAGGAVAGFRAGGTPDRQYALHDLRDARLSGAARHAAQRWPNWTATPASCTFPAARAAPSTGIFSSAGRSSRWRCGARSPSTTPRPTSPAPCSAWAWPSWAPTRCATTSTAAPWSKCWPTPRPRPCPCRCCIPQGRMASPRVRAFADWVTALFADNPDLQAPALMPRPQARESSNA